MNVALIGTGYWGKKYVHTLMSIEDINLSWVCAKTDTEKFAPTNTKFTNNYKDILHDKDVECIIIATPLETHYEIAKDCLIARKHVLLEKPFTRTSEEASKLFHIAIEEELILMPGHIYLHHDGIVQLKKLIDNKKIGKVESFFSKRLSTSYKYLNALWEAGAHDIYILDYFFGDKYSYEMKNIMGDITHCVFNLEYNNKNKLNSPYIYNDPNLHIINVYIEVCNKYPNKVREIIINGSKKQAIFDDKSIVLIDNITREIDIVQYNNTISPLEKQCRHFFECIRNNNIKPISNAFDGFKNIQVLERINSLLNL